MIDEAVIAEMEKGWAAHGYVYQGVNRSVLKLKHFEDHSCALLKDKDVLEFACNAGLFGYLISQYAKSYTGVEPGNMLKDHKHSDIDYFKQTDITKSFIKTDNVKYINNTVGGFLETDKDTAYNALVICFALYHFSDKEIEMIKAVVLPKCDTVIIQNRNSKRNTIRNSQKLYKNKNIVKMLEAAGFKCTVYDFNNGKYSEIIAQK